MSLYLGVIFIILAGSLGVLIITALLHPDEEGDEWLR